jgi:hypothetical protein
MLSRSAHQRPRRRSRWKVWECELTHGFSKRPEVGCAYVVAAYAGSALGSQFTRLSDFWVHPDAVQGAVTVVWALGVPIVIATFARVAVKVVVCVAQAFFAGMIVMWWLFASRESSTAGVVFLWVWLVGIPAVIVLVVVADRTSPRTSIPPHSPRRPE